MTEDNDNFEKKLIAQLATSALNEQRIKRRWGIFFKLFFIVYIVTITVISLNSAYLDDAVEGGDGDGDGFAAVININGTIEANGPNSSHSINHFLRQAFKNENAKGIILNINSPGGSAVESNRIYKEIMRLREKHPEKKIYAVTGDYCASGGYFIAAATHKIFVDEASLVGSIGVIFSSFGFVNTMEKLGVERRVITAGTNKNMLDPFSEENEEGKAVVRSLVKDIHGVFISAVKEGRGDRLSTTTPEIFEGAVYSGIDSIQLGLADDYNDMGGVARDIIGVDEVVFYQEKKWFDEIAKEFSAASLMSSGFFTPRLQ